MPEGDAVILGNFLHSIQTNHRIPGALLVGETGAIAGERDDIRNSSLGRERNVFAKSTFDGRVILEAIQALGNLTSAGVAHGADQPIASRNFILVGLEEINAFQSYVRRVGRQVVQRNMRITPLANGLLNSSAPNDRNITRRP